MRTEQPCLCQSIRRSGSPLPEPLAHRAAFTSAEFGAGVTRPTLRDVAAGKYATERSRPERRRRVHRGSSPIGASRRTLSSASEGE